MVCPFCEGEDLVRNGGMAGNRQFRCKGCGKYFYERRRGDLSKGSVGALERECPFCGGVCVKRGFAKNGAQRFRCKGCGKMNTGLYPESPRSPGGPFRHRMTFYFCVRSEGRLLAYCQRHKMSLAQAIRAILRNVAVPKAAVSGRAVRFAPEVSPLAFAGLPDARGDSRRKRRGLARDMPSVYVTLKVSVGLDDLSRQGLVRMARGWGVTHQEAMRRLVVESG